MPKVGSKHFAYSRKGRKAAKAEAKRTGKSLVLPDHSSYASRLLNLLVESNWIQGAVNPEHKGYCTPMTKETCTPKRKALAERFKKAGRREGTQAGGRTGWKGKV
jgi:hypothetical protein